MLTNLVASAVVLATTSTAALAAPCNTPTPAPASIIYQAPRELGHGPVRREITLANDVRMNANGYKVIPVGAGQGDFRKLTLQGDNGTTKIQKIQIVFADHQTQTVREDTLLGRDARLTVDLAGNHPRAIAKVVVYGADHRGDFTLNAV